MGGGRASYKFNFSPLETLVNDTVCHPKSHGVESFRALRLIRPFREVLISKGKCTLNLGCPTSRRLCETWKNYHRPRRDGVSPPGRSKAPQISPAPQLFAWRNTAAQGFVKGHGF